MQHAVRTRTHLATVAMLATLASCGGGDAFVGSCSAPEMSDGSIACIDATADGEEFTRVLCRVGRGRWTEGQACDTSGAIGGCEQTNGSVMWIFPSAKAEDIDDVIAICSGRVITDLAAN